MLPLIGTSLFNEVYRLQRIDVSISRRGLNLFSMAVSWLYKELLSEQFSKMIDFLLEVVWQPPFKDFGTKDLNGLE